MAKICIAGAGVAGVVCAYYLAKGGIDVVVFDKNDYQHLTYDWHDDIEKTAWQEAGLPTPPVPCFDKRSWAFVPPLGGNAIPAPQQEASDSSIMRRPLLHHLIDMAEKAGASFVYSTPVSPLIKGDKLIGLIAGGHEIACDLVVDCTGVNSIIRSSLPQCYGITPTIASGDTFCAYRGFFSRTPGVEVPPELTNSVHLRHKGYPGISWCIADPTQAEVDILIGQVGKLEDARLQELLADLVANHPIIGNKATLGARKAIIPIRYPLLRMVGDGYVAIGDSAFMTIPLLGSGIAAGALAGRILGETIVGRQSVSPQALWHYQVAFYRAVGARFCGVDVLKRWLLSADAKDVQWLLTSGVLSQQDLLTTASGRLVKLTVGSLFSKLGKGMCRLPLLSALARVLSKGYRVQRLAMHIPSVYDLPRIEAWAHRLQTLIEG